MEFPQDFIWGTASSSYQIEGGAFDDGKGPSIWDTFSHRPGTIADGTNGDVACDSYHRFEEDLDILKSLGIRNYRFSVSWPRVIPEGTGDINKAGLEYYDKVVDGCIERGIDPWMTVYHWDLPQALEDKGGWQNRDTVAAFRDYTRVLAEHFGDRVKHWFTINEPEIFIGLGYGTGEHAPGLRLEPREQFRCWHNALLAHGEAVRVIRDVVPDAVIGAAATGMLGYVHEHLKETPKEISDFSFHTGESQLKDGHFFFFYQWAFDPMVKGKYPDDPISPWSRCAEEMSSEEGFREDMELISQPLDFLGLNIYNGTEMDPANGCQVMQRYVGFPRTAIGWHVTPEVMYWGPRQIWERYGLPMVISEDGQSCNDRIFLDGKVHDPDRIDFLQRYLEELSDVIKDGVPVKGFFHWSFTDNLEWNSGYDERFGLVYIDYRTQDRTVKDSAYWYSRLIQGKQI
ncbi:MAG: beta-glucosidase [Eubacterium sp.]|nr:beta-glucosidase [Eubacterium sp.]